MIDLSAPGKAQHFDDNQLELVFSVNFTCYNLYLFLILNIIIHYKPLVLVPIRILIQFLVSFMAETTLLLAVPANIDFSFANSSIYKTCFPRKLSEFALGLAGLPETKIKLIN
jgi:hypothetical protein